MLRTSAPNLTVTRGKLASRPRRLGIENLEDRRVFSADPGWLATIGGPGSDSTNQVAVDSTGDVYVAGYFSGTVDFDQAAAHAGDADILTSIGPRDGYAAKYSSAGDLLWAHRMGGLSTTNSDSARSIAIGTDGIYVAGSYVGDGYFDGNALPDQPNRGGADAFVTKLDSTYGTALWTKTFGGNYDDTGSSLALASDGSLFVTGTVADSAGTVDLDPGSGTAPLVISQNGAVYVLNLNAAGNYIKSWGINATDTQDPPRIAVDASGVYLSGTYRGSVDFDPGPGQVIRQPYLGGNQHDAFVARYSQQGEFGWVQTLRGTNTNSWEDHIYGLAMDADRVYVGGNYYYGLDLNYDNIADLPGNATRDIFVASYSKTTGSLSWAKKAGTAVGDDAARSLGVDHAGALLVYGYFNGTVDFDPGSGVSNLTTANQANYSWKLDAATGTYRDAARLDVSVSSVLESGGMLYLAGSFGGTATFPNGSAVTSAGGSNDGYVLKLNATGPRVAITSPSSGQALIEGASISFTGTATDDQDGNLTSSLVWQSQLVNGTLGTGGSVGAIVLPVGAHDVSARAVDSDGLAGSSSVTVLVNPKAPTSLTGTVSGSQVTLRWTDNSGGNTNYQVERAVKPNGKNATPQWSIVATLAGSAVIHVESPGTGNWLYRLQATGAGAVSAYSNELSVSVSKGGPKAASLSFAVSSETLTATLASPTAMPASLPISLSDSDEPVIASQPQLVVASLLLKSRLIDRTLERSAGGWLDHTIADDLLHDLIALH